MFRAYQAVLQPTATQRLRLDRLLGAQRELYNAALEERIGVWRWQRRSVSRFEQFRCLTGWAHPVLEFGVCPARGTLTRLDRAFAGFYQRCRRGETPGFPRFKSAARWDSVEYPDKKCWKIEREQRGTGRIHLKGVGPPRGEPLADHGLLRRCARSAARTDGCSGGHRCGRDRAGHDLRW